MPLSARQLTFFRHPARFYAFTLTRGSSSKQALVLSHRGAFAQLLRLVYRRTQYVRLPVAPPLWIPTSPGMTVVLQWSQRGREQISKGRLRTSWIRLVDDYHFANPEMLQRILIDLNPQSWLIGDGYIAVGLGEEGVG